MSGQRVIIAPGVQGTIIETHDTQRVTVAWDDGHTTNVRTDQLRVAPGIHTWMIRGQSPRIPGTRAHEGRGH